MLHFNFNSMNPVYILVYHLCYSFQSFLGCKILFTLGNCLPNQVQEITDNDKIKPMRLKKSSSDIVDTKQSACFLNDTANW